MQRVRNKYLNKNVKYAWPNKRLRGWHLSLKGKGLSTHSENKRVRLCNPTTIPHADYNANNFSVFILINFMPKSSLYFRRHWISSHLHHSDEPGFIEVSSIFYHFPDRRYSIMMTVPIGMRPLTHCFITPGSDQISGRRKMLPHS